MLRICLIVLNEFLLLKYNPSDRKRISYKHIEYIFGSVIFLHFHEKWTLHLVFTFKLIKYYWLIIFLAH